MKKWIVIMLVCGMLLVLSGCVGETGENENTPMDNIQVNYSLSIVERITAVERGADESATSRFNARVISETLAETGFGMYDDFGGCILVFELENISEHVVTVDISAVFHREHGQSAWLIDQNVSFESGEARQFTHSFGEYDFTPSLHLVIEYMNVRY